MKSKITIFSKIVLCLFLILFGSTFAQNSDSGYIQTGNGKIFYECSGSGEVIILIHDGLLPSAVWDEQFAFFSEDYRVIRYDRRGYGRSSPAEGTYSHLEDLSTLFRELKLESANLIACSSGGALAIDFTLKYPNKVRSLVLVGAVVGGFSYTHHFYSRGGYMPEEFEDAQERSIYYASYDPYEIYYQNTAVRQKALRLLKKYPRRVHNHPTYERHDIPAYRRLNEIQIPALILVGEFDMPDVHAHAGAIDAGIPNSRRDIIPKSGHLIPMEQPDSFNQAVLDFLEHNKESN